MYQIQTIKTVEHTVHQPDKSYLKQNIFEVHFMIGVGGGGPYCSLLPRGNQDVFGKLSCHSSLYTGNGLKISRVSKLRTTKEVREYFADLKQEHCD